MLGTISLDYIKRNILIILKEENNSIKCVDNFVYTIFLTDEDIFSIKKNILEYIKFKKPRVFYAKFTHENDYIKNLGGWNRTIRFFDFRKRKVENSFNKP